MPAGRRASIDWARGIAVLLMIEAHTVDAWTRAADRNSAAFGYLIIVGGFAAPLFLWLAGIGLALSASRVEQRTGRRTDAAQGICRRGLEIFLLAFLFRLQAFIVSPGSHPVMLFRVDVLNVMGLAVAVAGLVWLTTTGTTARTTVYAAVAAAIALATPIVRATPAVDLLPTWIQWYLRPAGEMTTFTLFPWAGFVFAGASAGAQLARTSGGAAGRDERRLQAMLAAAAAILVAVAFWASTRPTIYHVPASFWTSSPTWFAIRVGILMLALAALAALPLRADAAVARLGRASLFVYWIHVELVYGYASWLWRHRLPVWASVVGWIAFACLMFAAVVARDRIVARRPIGFPGPAPLPQA